MKDNEVAVAEKKVGLFQRCKNKVAQLSAAVAMAGYGLMGKTAYAINIKTGNGGKDVLHNGMDNVTGLVLNVATGIGAVIFVYGIISLGLGLAQDNPDGQSRGIKFLIGGAVISSAMIVVQWFS